MTTSVFRRSDHSISGHSEKAQYFDPETGLHYNVHRYYDPETARYVTADPLGLDPAPNALTHVENPHTWPTRWG